MPGVEYVEAEEIRKRPFRVAITPLPSLYKVLADSVGSGRNGAPLAWRRAVRAHLRQRDYELLAPLATPGRTPVPDALLGMAEPPGESFEAGIERMIATSGDELLGEVEMCGAGQGNDTWRELERDPHRWLRGYVAVLLRAWKGFAPVWQRARVSLDREVERIGVATALDAQLELLDGLLVDGRVEAGRWNLRCDYTDGRKMFPETGLVLMPLLAGDGGSIIDVVDSTMRRIGYPVPSGTDLGVHDSTVPALEGLLGVPRAQILRALDCPTSIGRLAEALGAVPSAATHHVSALEAAGLVVRDRCGRQVLVHLTDRGRALLELYPEFEPSSRRIRAAARGTGTSRGRGLAS